MKELSIEEKAKRYDEALEKARQLCDYPTTKPFISDLQDLFPELAESEDERIRKEIIDFIYDNETERDAKSSSKWIAWLEKQGEQKLPILTISPPQNDSGLRKQKPAWSEEDENKLSKL